MISHVHDFICCHYDIIVWKLWYHMLTHIISYSWKLYMKSYIISRFGTLWYHSVDTWYHSVDIWYHVHMISYIKCIYDIVLVYTFICMHNDIICQYIKSYVDLWFHRVPRIQMWSGCAQVIKIDGWLACWIIVGIGSSSSRLTRTLRLTRITGSWPGHWR